MNRLLFEKTGAGVWISHLDLMRLFQRGFRRAGVTIKRSHGMAVRDYVSIVLPLSVGASSVCELLEFELEDESVPLDTLPEKLNATFPDGIRVLRAYRSERSAKELTWLRARLILEYDDGVPADAAEQIRTRLLAESVVVEKRSKKGMVETDIRPLLHELEVVPGDEDGVLWCDCIVSAQNPALNPELLHSAIARYLPQYSPSFAKVRRLEILDAAFQAFR